MRKTAARVFSAALGGLLASGPVHAQNPPWRGVEFGVGTAPWVGANADVFEAGVRGVVSLWAEASRRTHVGVELVYGRFGSRTGGPSPTEGAVHVTVRRMLGKAGGADLFGGLRAGLHRLTGLESRDDTRQIGASAGPELGVEIPVGGSLRVILAGEGHWGWYADASSSTTTYEESGGYAFRYGVRVGAAVRP